jgi:hypothetical protein
MIVPNADSQMVERMAPENFLARIDALVDWSALLPSMEGLSAQAGVKLPLSAVKIYLLKHWYELADNATEFAVLDRLSFRAFVGFAGDGSSSDVEILNELREGGWTGLLDLQKIAEAVEEQLRNQGFTVRPGYHAEASMVPCTEGELSAHTTADTALPEGSDLRAGNTVRAKSRSPSPPTGPLPDSADWPVDLSLNAAGGPPARKGVRVENERARALLEWPWGQSTDLIDILQIGRDYKFSPFASELTPYTHVSRRHAELMVQGDSVWIKDLGSRNGTYVNNDEVPKGQAFLIDADAIVRFGPLLAVSLKLLP